ncbi:hypothetical protein P8452_39459 [Trifolium repens]|nr:hypothetical protein P8452_39459 [Trifolium repens]
MFMKFVVLIVGIAGVLVGNVQGLPPCCPPPGSGIECQPIHSTRKEESQKATSTAKLGGGDDVELQNGMTVSIVTAYGSLKVHLIQSLAVLTVYGVCNLPFH